MNIISIASKSPHAIIDGYTLRIHHIIKELSSVPDVNIEVISPILPGEQDAAIDWANSLNIKLHVIEIAEKIEWKKTLRRRFTTE